MATAPNIRVPSVTDFTDIIRKLQVQLNLHDSENTTLVDSAVRECEQLQDFLLSAQSVISARRKPLLGHVSMNIVQPIYRLPVEVLYIIISIAFEEDTARNWQAPQYGQVCRHWKAIAEGLPELWRYLDFKLPSSRTPQLLADRARTWIKRSKNRSIKVCLSFDPDATQQLSRSSDDSPVLFCLESIASVLVQHAEKLDALFIREPGREPVRRLHQMLLGIEDSRVSFPNVTSFVLYGNRSLPRPQETIALSRLFPNLHTLRIPFLEPLVQAPVLRPAWTGMRDFRGTLELDGFTALCQHGRLLERAEINVVTDIDPRDLTTDGPLDLLNQPHPPLQHLVSLSLNIPELVKLFPPLPSLRYLILKNVSARNTPDLEEPMKMWGRQLTYLALGGDLSSGQVKKMLKYTPHLQGLAVICNTGTAELPKDFLDFVPELMYLEMYAQATAKGAKKAQGALQTCRTLKADGECGLTDVVFYPTTKSLDASLYGPNARVPNEEARRAWKSLCEELMSVGLKARVYGEFSDLMCVNRVVDQMTFNTAFFVDHGFAKYPEF